mgnify:CR=1 FL=1
MKKRLFFLLTTMLLAAAAFAQGSVIDSTKKKSPHLTFLLQENVFYYTKGAEKEKTKIEVVDSLSVATIINVAITQNKVAKKDLKVHIEGDDLMDHPRFDVLINTILSKTVSEVRVRTNVLE